MFFCTLTAVFITLAGFTGTGEHSLHYFTLRSNLLSAIAAAFMIHYAAEGIRKKRFVLPRWIVLLQYAAAVSVAVTMFSALALILPTQGSNAVTGTNFWLHIITPAFTVALFECVETGIAFARRDMLLAMIPLWLYMAVYFVMVILVGEKRGGWSDFYMTRAFWPAWISVLLMLAVGFAVSLVLRLVQNKRAAQSWKRTARMWSEDLEPTEPLIEAFGLGRYIGTVCEASELTVPLDIFERMAERYGVPLEALAKAYVKGALDVRFNLFTRSKHRFLRIAGWAARCVVAALTLVIVCFFGKVIRGSLINTADRAEHAIVLGMALENGQPTADLLARLDTAEAYLEAYPEAQLILTGGNADEPGRTEAAVMQDILAERGVADARMLLEDRAETTKANFRNTAQLIDPGAPVVLISSDYHMDRAAQIAKSAGFSNILRLPAPSSFFSFGANVMFEVVLELNGLTLGK